VVLIGPRASRGRGQQLAASFSDSQCRGRHPRFCFEVRDDSGAASPGYYRMFRVHCASFLLQLRFNRRALPARCTRQFRTRDDATPVESDELPCDMGGGTSAFFRDAGPGLAGNLEWS
jgi:hypothetical protein